MKFFDLVSTIIIFVIVFCAGIIIFWDRSEFKVKDLASISDINFQENKEEIQEEDFSGVGVADPISTEESLQDILDDISEKLDIIQAEVDKLLIEKDVENKKLDEEILKEEVEEKVEKEKNEDEQETKKLETEKINYLKVLIFEVKISPINERFVKLFNPNSEIIDLTGWYLQRKTATGSDFTSCISKNDFEGKIILPNNYLVISKEDLVLTENNTLILKNPNGEISDSVNTGFEVQTTITGGGSVAETKSCVGQININTASIEQLKELTGIGDTKAQAIIDARPFTSLDDLLKVDGIGQATLQKIKDQNCAYVEESVLPKLKNIEIRNLPLKTSYFVGENLDITDLIVVGNYVNLCEDGEFPAGTQEIEITKENIIGFDSSVPILGQVLTINFEGFTAEYSIDILEPLPATQLKIISAPQKISVGDFSDIFEMQSQNELGNPTKVLTTTYINLSSDSSTGLFFDASFSGGCNLEKNIESVTMKSGSKNKAFCYKDDTPGIFEIIVSANELLSDFQNIEILGTTSPTDK